MEEYNIDVFLFVLSTDCKVSHFRARRGFFGMALRVVLARLWLAIEAREISVNEASLPSLSLFPSRLSTAASSSKVSCLCTPIVLAQAQKSPDESNGRSNCAFYSLSLSVSYSTNELSLV